MTAHIRLLPSGHEFDAEPGETLLEAALRSGLSLRYSCNSGSCGECRARLIEGQLGPLQHHDYAFSEQERAGGQFLLCRATAATDLVTEAVEARGAADVPLQDITTQVGKVTALSHDVLEVQLRTPRSRTLWFLAGQHVRLHLPGIPPRHKSVASCPCNGMVLQFHVRRATDDPFAEYVFTRLKPRDPVRIEGPYGDFVLDESSSRPILFIAFETGFAPIKSLVEHAISLEFRQRMRLYWVTRRGEDHYMANHCRAWQDALDDFAFIQVSGEAAAEGLTEAEAAMASATRLICDAHPDIVDYDVYVNGPDVLFAALNAALLKHGLPPDRLFVDHVQRF